MKLSRKALLAYSLIGIWLAGLIAALWWFQGQYVRSFDEQTVIFSSQGLSLPPEIAGQGTIRLVHFWDPKCPCNTGNQQHLADLMQRFGNEVSFYAVQKPNSKGALPKNLESLQKLKHFPGVQHIPSTPAVGIWDRQGQLAYFGPYSAGLSCNSSNSFIEPILEALKKNRPVSVDNSLAVGCFCQWQQ